jgi:sugar lactone lactonase YvrE
MLPNASIRRALAALGLALLAAGCAGAQRPKEEDLPRWPLPPEKPRVKFVRSLASEEDLPKGFGRRLLGIFVPSSAEAVVAQPTGLALSPDERYLYVACASASRVVRFDLREGKADVVADQDGQKPASPFGLATDAEGNLYVSDLRSGVFAYGPDGKFLRRYTESLVHPTGVAVDSRRKLLYAVSGTIRDGGEHRIEVFSLDGKHLRTIGSRGSGGGQFNYPAHLAVAKDGNLFVVDMLNFRVQVFDPEGRLVSMFGTIGAGQPGTFDKAKSVAFDSFGNIYVVDSQQAWVQVFNSKFYPLMAFGGRLTLPGYMLSPTAIAISSKNTIWVADLFASRVNEYQLINTTAEDSFLPAPETARSPNP